MVSEYTPTTNEVRKEYQWEYYGDERYRDAHRAAEFDRWLALERKKWWAMGALGIGEGEGTGV